MRRLIEVLAVLVLVITLGVAGTAFYGYRVLFPKFEGGTVAKLSSGESAVLVEQWQHQAEHHAFPGTVKPGMDTIPEEASFTLYTVRLNNKGFFPAEWIAVDSDFTDGDVMMLGTQGANTLAQGTEGDVSLLVLGMGDKERVIRVNCYVLGWKRTLTLSAGSEGITIAEDWKGEQEG